MAEYKRVRPEFEICERCNCSGAEDNHMVILGAKIVCSECLKEAEAAHG